MQASSVCEWMDPCPLQAQGLEAFLEPLFRLDPDARPSAAQMLQHPWLLSHTEDAIASASRAGADAMADYDSEEAQALLDALLASDAARQGGSGASQRR